MEHFFHGADRPGASPALPLQGPYLPALPHMEFTARPSGPAKLGHCGKLAVESSGIGRTGPVARHDPTPLGGRPRDQARRPLASRTPSGREQSAGRDLGRAPVCVHTGGGRGGPMSGRSAVP